MSHPASHHAAGFLPARGPCTIGVAYVDSEEGREALHAAYALARRPGATLRVLTVLKGSLGMYSEIEASYAGQLAGRNLEDVQAEHRVQLEQQVREIVADLDGDVPVEIDTYVGDPAGILIDVSSGLDLLVCGSRGRGPLKAVLLGSVSRRVAAEAHCPVIVIPRGVKAPFDALSPRGAGGAGIAIAAGANGELRPGTP